jgi:hypothetical protein
MEVHHHTNTSHRKWTHYLWEFIMLFLAVFCGFLAENFREHQQEHARERTYIKSMIEDVATDTMMLTRVTNTVMVFPLVFDTICQISYSKVITDSMVTALYKYHRKYSNIILPISFTNRTSAQLRNAGAMRLIRNNKVADAITQYWDITALVERNGSNYEEYRKDLLNFGYQLFSDEYFDRKSVVVIPILRTQPELMTRDPKMLKSYANRISHLASVIRSFYIPNIEKHLDQGRKLIALMKKEYHIE